MLHMAYEAELCKIKDANGGEFRDEDYPHLEVLMKMHAARLEIDYPVGQYLAKFLFWVMHR